MGNKTNHPRKHEERDRRLLEMYAAGTPIKALVAEFKISKGRIYAIINKRYLRGTDV